MPSSSTKAEEAALRQLVLIEKLKNLVINGDGSDDFPGLFDRQRKAFHDRSRFQSWLCSRRAGKSKAAAHKIVFSLLGAGFKQYVVYGAHTRAQAERNVWDDIALMVERLQLEQLLGWKLNHGECTITTPQGAHFFLMGFADKGEIGKLRGIDCLLVVLDEVQEYTDLLQPLVHGAIRPLLFKLRGALLLLGTPHFVLDGLWFQISTGLAEGWSRHRWTLLDNPHIPDPERLIADETKAMGLPLDDPYVQREYFGQWKTDDSKLVYPTPHVVPLPDEWRLDDAEWVRSNLTCTFGIDYGFDPDPSGWIVLAQRRGDSRAYVVSAEKVARTNDDRYAQITHDKYVEWEPTRMVADYGGGGKGAIGTFNEKFAHELGIELENADKSQKRSHMDMLRIDLRSGRIVVAKDLCAELLQELSKLVWKNELRKEVAPGCEKHLCDALLYAWRAHFKPGDAVEPKAKPYGYFDVEDHRAAMNERVQREIDRARDPFSYDLFVDDEWTNV